MDWLVWKKKVLEEHDYDVTIASWSFDDASNITSLFHSSSARPWGNNFVMYKNSEVDSIAACVILEQWLQRPKGMCYEPFS